MRTAQSILGRHFTHMYIKPLFTDRVSSILLTGVSSFQRSNIVSLNKYILTVVLNVRGKNYTAKNVILYYTYIL